MSKHTFPLELVEEAMFGLSNLGGCTACGEVNDGCEPDARDYECEFCGERAVYGMEELMVMGLVE